MPQKYVAGYLTSSTFINQSFNLLLIYITKGIRNYILSNLSLTNDKIVIFKFFLAYSKVSFGKITLCVSGEFFIC